MREPPTHSHHVVLSSPCYYRLRVPRLVPESLDMRREAVRELIAFLEPIPPPAPRFSDFGLALMSLHFGMCRSAAVALKVRPQCGQGTKSGSGVDATVGIVLRSLPSLIAFCTCRFAFIASRSALDFFFQLSFFFSFISFSLGLPPRRSAFSASFTNFAASVPATLVCPC